MQPSTQHVFTKGAPGAPFFTPVQTPASGTAIVPQTGGKSIPKLFTPIKIRDVTFQNRIFLSPLCQYSALDGHTTPWHLCHLGGIISRGPGLSFVEATAVVPEGRITPQDTGIWDDAHIAGLKQIVEFAHSQNQKIGIQLAHAGRKASTVPPFVHFKAAASVVAGGWQTVGASANPYTPDMQVPKELTKSELQVLVKAYADAAKRAVAAGFDVIEIHSAHGYLLSSFLSPAANKRTDEFGGSFENRTRLSLEIIDVIRGVIPDGMPLFMRYNPLCFPAHGVDLLDISSAGNDPRQDFSNRNAHQEYSAAVKASEAGSSILVGTVGGIYSGVQAEEYLQSDIADVCFVGRHFQKNPGLVWKFAEELDVDINVAAQIRWGFFGRMSATLGGPKK